MLRSHPHQLIQYLKVSLITLPFNYLLILKLYEKYNQVKAIFKFRFPGSWQCHSNPCYMWSPMRSKSMGKKQNGDFHLCSVVKSINIGSLCLKNFCINSAHTNTWEWAGGVREDQGLSGSCKSKYVTKKKKYLCPTHTHVTEVFPYFPLPLSQTVSTKQGKMDNVLEQMTLFERWNHRLAFMGGLRALLRGNGDACSDLWSLLNQAGEARPLNFVSFSWAVKIGARLPNCPICWFYLVAQLGGVNSRKRCIHF